MAIVSLSYSARQQSLKQKCSIQIPYNIHVEFAVASYTASQIIKLHEIHKVLSFNQRNVPSN